MFIDPVPAEDARGLTADIYESEQEGWGFLPDFVRVFSHHPEAFRAWRGLIKTVYGSMDRRRCELATLAAARALKSTCCSMAHGRVLRDRFYTASEVVQISLDHHSAGLDDVDVAIMDFAEKAATDPSGTSQEDIDRLKRLGLSDREVFDIALAVAARSFFATLSESLGTRAERPIVDDLEPELRDALVVGRSVDPG
ncbi:MAG TPA: peroxidase [Acidimicrobiia bacterium]|nr:peroxidase [Acidimicrobiia bacterium]